MSFADFITRDLKSINHKVISDDMKLKHDPDYFPVTGTQVFCGRQGSGKTISMVKTALELHKKYPKSLLVTNLNLNVDFDYYGVNNIDELGYALSNINNGFNGVIYAIDEIHVYFNALDSKNIPMYIFQQISQQRKQRKLIIGTSQLFLRMAKPFREQCDTVVMCRCYFGKFNVLTVYDGASIDEDGKRTVGDVMKTGWFMQTKELRESYDTYQVIQSGREEYKEGLKVLLDKRR